MADQLARSNSTYILVHKRRMEIIDRYEANEDDPQPAESAKRYFGTNFAYDPLLCRIFVMLGDEPALD
jgi:hypothetical protein